MSNNFALTAVAVFAWLFTAFAIAFIAFYYFEASDRGNAYLTARDERRAAIKRNRRK